VRRFNLKSKVSRAPVSKAAWATESDAYGRQTPCLIVGTYFILCYFNPDISRVVGQHFFVQLFQELLTYLLVLKQTSFAG
jgi:hypothetical protein